MYRVGLIGCGGIAVKHAEALVTLKDEVELAACCDIDVSKAAAFSSRYTDRRARVFDSFTQMVKDVKIDLAVICLPPFAHSNEVELAAQRGIHVLVEKPIALSSHLAWKMVEQAEAAGIKTQVGFIFRFGEAVEQLRYRQAAGETGRVGLFSARYACNSLHTSWWRQREKSGGQLVEQVIHLFDLMRFLMGEPASVFSRQANFFHQDVPDYSIEDVSVTVTTFASGALGVVYATNGAVPGLWIKEWRLVAEKMVAEFSDWNHAVFTPTTPLADPVAVVSEKDVFLAQLQDLLHAIRTGGETRTPLREGARSLDLVLAARRSSETHAEIQL